PGTFSPRGASLFPLYRPNILFSLSFQNRPLAGTYSHPGGSVSPLPEALPPPFAAPLSAVPPVSSPEFVVLSPAAAPVSPPLPSSGRTGSGGSSGSPPPSPEWSAVPPDSVPVDAPLPLSGSGAVPFSVSGSAV